MRVLVCGGRTYDNWRRLQAVLAEEHAVTPFALLISGGAPGADRLGEKWAAVNRVPLCIFPANWTHLGRRAGPMRNRHMLEFARPTLVIAFPGNIGTPDMIAAAKAASVEVLEVEP